MIRHALRRVMAGLALMLVCIQPAQADYAAGKRAWDAMRPAEAFKEWRAAANGGDRRAMLALGRLYMQGVGAPQDYILAHMWFNLAAARGEMAAAKERDALAAKMTPQQVASAQERARTWRPGGGERKPAAGPSPPPRAIREAQGLLSKLGYKPGPADGRWGGRTARSYARFLGDAGLPRGDVLTPGGLRALRAAAKGRGTKTSAATPSRPKVRPGTLHRAVLAGDVDGLKAALEGGADVNARDRRGWTALMHAVNKGYVLLVGPLLEAKADPDVRAADGATALFMAAVHGHSEVIELLMKGGANPLIKGPKGRTPVDVARKRYGEASGAREQGESPGVLALLTGRTWAQVAEEADDAAFERARSAGTQEAYAGYLSSRPRGRHREEVLRLKAELEARVDDAAFERARSEGTPSAYAGYLSAYPQGRHAGEALRLKAKADDAAFERARSEGTSAAYAGYLSSNPRGRHAEEALRLKTQAEAKEDDAAYERARSEGTSAAYAGYLSSNPRGRHAEEARRLKAKAQAAEEADDAAFERARTEGTSAAYAGYLSVYPQGRHAGEARRLKEQQAAEEADDAAFERARSAGAPTAYAGYLSSYPRGRHAEEARRLKAQIEELNRKWPAGKVFSDCPDCPEMVVVPAGSFLMGSPSDVKGREPDEGPRHRVTILRPFAVGKHEVTKYEYEVFVGESGRSTFGNCHLHDPRVSEWKSGEDIRLSRPGFEQSDLDPVVCVSWDDAKAYAKWLSEKTDQEYRLLSESEWEYAVRAAPMTRRNPLLAVFGAGWGRRPVTTTQIAMVASAFGAGSERLLPDRFR